jgi:hypothetical protein
MNRFWITTDADAPGSDRPRSFGRIGPGQSGTMLLLDRTVSEYGDVLDSRHHRLAATSDAKTGDAEARCRLIATLRKFGSERGTRTPDPRIMIPVL